jgi:hypothetical protein
MINTDAIEQIIDSAYAEWLTISGNKTKKRQHPSRTEYGEIFRQSFPWVGSLLIITESKEGGDKIE